MNDWHKKVYKKVRQELPGNWSEIRKAILERDKYTCYRCLKQNKRGTGLSPNHLIPRIDGGKNNPENLITLCHSCHDFVELNNLRTLVDISGSIDLGIEIRQISQNGNSESFERPSWHSWVYGGSRNPKLDE